MVDRRIYDTPQHRTTRAHTARQVKAGNAYCTEPVCLMPTRWIQPGSAWDLAHAADGTTYRGPAHARCNRSEGATRGNHARGGGMASGTGTWHSRRW